MRIEDPDLDRVHESIRLRLAPFPRAQRRPFFEPVRWTRRGHRALVAHPLFGPREARRHIEDRLTVLMGDHAPGRECTTVSDAIDHEPEREVVAPGAEKIGMDRMEQARGTPFVYGRDGCDDGLCGDHATKEAPLAPARITEKQVTVQLFEDESFAELVDLGLLLVAGGVAHSIPSRHDR